MQSVNQLPLVTLELLSGEEVMVPFEQCVFKPRHLGGSTVVVCKIYDQEFELRATMDDLMAIQNARMAVVSRIPYMGEVK